MRKQRSSHIINISSGAGLCGGEGWGLYCSTKFTVEDITETLARELKPLGIHVTAIEPGFLIPVSTNKNLIVSVLIIDAFIPYP
jgi:NAD(P)-dependent dehydrogenase (short-subunit alcohol dehydrogenase family)